MTSKLAIEENALPFLRDLVGNGASVAVLVDNETEKALVEKFNQEVLAPLNKTGFLILSETELQEMNSKEDLIQWLRAQVSHLPQMLTSKGFESLWEASNISEKLRKILDDVDPATPRMFQGLGVDKLLAKFNEFKAQFAP